jgi:hypothetical protein
VNRPKLRKGFWIYLPVAIFAWITPLTTSVKADVLGEWTYSQSQNCGGYIEVVDNAITLHGPDNQLAPQGSPCGGAHWVKIETTIPDDLATLDFTWSYQTNDGWVYDPPQYGINGVYTLITQVNTSSGTLSVPVEEGDIFTFRQYSIDTCCQPGHLTISNLSLWNGIAAPTTTVPPDTTTIPPDTTTIPPDTTIPADTTIPENSSTSSVLQTTLPEESTTTSTTLEIPTITVPDLVVPEVPTGTTVLEQIEVPTVTTLPEEIPAIIPEVIPTETTDLTPDITYPDTTVDTDETLPFVGEVISDAVLTNILEDTFTPDASTEEITAALDDILSADLSTEQFSTVMDAVLADTTDTEQVSEVLVSLLSSNLSDEELTIVMDTVFSEEASVEEMGAIVDNMLDSDLSPAELEAVFTAAFDGDLSDAETVALAAQILDSPLDDNEFATVINAIFDEEVSDEVLTQTFDAILTPELSDSKFEEVVNILENDTITNDQVAQVVDLVISQEGGVSEGQATELATSAKVLESVSGEQAAEVFDAIVASAVTPENGLAIVDAVQDAPKAVKESFEEELNVYEGVFDTYTAIGSGIPVSGRRVIIGVVTVSFILPAPVVSRRVI